MAMTYVPVEVVDTTNLSEADWLNYRRTGIGGSDAAAVMGVSPFATARDLYYDKRNIHPALPDDANWVAKRVGRLLEDLVADIFVKKTGLKIFQIKKMFRHPLHGFMLADVDYFVELPGGKIAILECKTANYNTQYKWQDGAVPLNYELQGRHYMAVMNLDTVFFACLFGNNESEFVYRRVERDHDQEADLIAQEQFFWEEYVQKGVEPPYTEPGDLVLESIRRHYGEANADAPEVLLNAVHALRLEAYLDLSAQKSALAKQVRDLEGQMKQAYAPVVDAMGTGCTALCKCGDREYTITYKPSYRTAIGKDNLERLLLLHPDIHDEYAETTESRRFSVTVKN